MTYTPTTEEVRGDYTAHSATYAGKPTSESGPEFDRWLAEVERAASEKAWWEACLRITIGENNSDIAHVYQKKNPYTEET